MKALIAICVLAVTAGCGYVLRYDPQPVTGLSPWRADAVFHVYRGEPDRPYTLVARIVALSDAGDYPDEDRRLRIAKEYAKKHGGNGVILNQGKTIDSPDPFNVIRVILVDGDKKKDSPNPTSEGIRQPADGSPKPSM